MAQLLGLRTAGLVEPLGLDLQPVFSWTLQSEQRNLQTHAVQVTVHDQDGMVWDSGRVPYPAVPELAYAGPALRPLQTYSWIVQVWSGSDEENSSASTTFETGLLGGELGAQWIALDEATPEGSPSSVQYLRTEVALTGPIRRARAITTALGWYRLHINGTDVSGPGYFPGFTAFESRLEYQVRDITEHLSVGDNVIGIVLSDGRFRGRLSGMGLGSVYGNHIAAIARIEIELESGERVVVATDDRWHGGHGRIRTSDPRGGEEIDTRIGDDWDLPQGSIAEPLPVRNVDEHRHLVGVSAEPALMTEEFPEVAQTSAPSGALIIDFGTNIHGTARLRLSGPAGSTVLVHHAEVLGVGGEVDTDYLMGDLPMPVTIGKDRFTLSGGEDVFMPTFCTQGFRYISVSVPEGLEVLEATAVAATADFPYLGSFECSDPLVNAFHEIVVRSMKGNFFDVPMDCPTRERSGWTGDAQAFAHTALLLADARNYLSNWVVDMGLQQTDEGLVYDIVPHDFRGWIDPTVWEQFGIPAPQAGSAGWGDAIVMIPWTIYWATGSKAVLQRSYDSMVAWVELRAKTAREQRGAHRGDSPVEPHEQFLLETGWHYGEWLEPEGEGDGTTDVMGLMESLATTPRAWVATAYFEHSARLLAAIAEVVGRGEDQLRFTAYADGAKDAWQREFIGADGALIPDAQASYVRALEFDLLPPELRNSAVARLVERIRQRDDHLGTGFLSTGFLLGQLSGHGHGAVALDILLQRTAPSWIYQIEHGATTTWETWTGADATGKPYLSQNHYSLGAAARWLYEGLAGLRSTAPGWTSFTIDPYLDPRITSATARTSTPFGPAESSWRLDGKRMSLTAQVPVGALAQVVLHGARDGDAVDAGAPIESLGAVEVRGDDLVVSISSGTYHFEWDRQPTTQPA